MKIAAVAITAALVGTTTVAVAAFDEGTGKYGAIDTNRAPRLFNPPKNRKPGYTYADEILIDLNAEMDSMGMAIKGEFDAKGDMEMKVTGQSGGSVRIDMAIQNVEASLVSPFMAFDCNSHDPAHAEDEMCKDLLSAVGETESVLMDADGNILEMTTPDGEKINVAAMEQQTLNDKFKANQLAASHHADKMQQFLKLIPDHAVRPGDTWIEDLDLERIGNFKGESSLKGYTEYQGADCAVFYMEGNLHLDVGLIAQGLGVDSSQLPVDTADAHIINEIVWDVNDQIARWITVNITTSFDIANPLNPDPNDQSKVHIPAELWLAIATDITAGPDGDEAGAGDGGGFTGGASESLMYQPPSHDDGVTYSIDTDNSKGGGGAFKGIFFGILVGGLAVGGFLFYKKQQENWEIVRPSYEFSPVGSSEPIYTNTQPMV